jgi:putative transcriptional regulator
MAEANDLKIFKVNLGKRIKNLRKAKNYTQPDLAALLNIDYQAIGRIENGRVNPSAYLVSQIAQALNVSITEIYDFSELG